MISVGINNRGRTKLCQTIQNILEITVSWLLLSFLKKIPAAPRRADDKYSKMKAETNEAYSDMVKRGAKYGSGKGSDSELMAEMATKAIHKYNKENSKKEMYL